MRFQELENSFHLPNVEGSIESIGFTQFFILGTSMFDLIVNTRGKDVPIESKNLADAIVRPTFSVHLLLRTKDVFVHCIHVKI